MARSLYAAHHTDLSAPLSTASYHHKLRGQSRRHEIKPKFGTLGYPLPDLPISERLGVLDPVN